MWCDDERGLVVSSPLSVARWGNDHVDECAPWTRDDTRRRASRDRSIAVTDRARKGAREVRRETRDARAGERVDDGDRRARCGDGTRTNERAKARAMMDATTRSPTPMGALKGEGTSRMEDAMWAAVSVVTPARCERAREETRGGDDGDAGEARRARGASAGKSALRRAGERRRAILSEPCAVPVVRFGAVDVGKSSAETLEIVNDTALTREVTFRESDVFARDGFVVDRQTVTVQPGTTECVEITWTPQKVLAATYCGQLAFTVVAEAPVPMPEVEMKARIRGVAKGEVLRAITNEESHTASTTKRPRDARLATRRTLVASPKKLGFEDKAALERIRVKQRRLEEESTDLSLAPVARALQLHRGEEATKEDASNGATVSDEFQADIWLRQQELAFIAWLNHTIVVDDAGRMGDDSPTENRGGNASAREVRQIVRNKLTSLYSYDDELGRVFKKTYRHVDNARFRLNTGQTFMDNVALKEDFTRALSSYSPFWLQLGVDVVVGGGVTWKRSNDLGDIQRECIAKLCRDRDLEIEFGTGHTPGAPPFAHGYEEALSRNILKRVLLLVFILDRAAMSGVPPNTPLLMRPRAALKRSEDILRAALQGSMYGEGDIVRNLSQCSYKLHYRQNPIREYDFQCTNLAVDLRDGVRLCRLMEVLNADVLFMSYDEKNKEWKRSLLSEVHFPCASRSHRIQNVEVALRAIKDQQVGLPGTWSQIKAEDIVDGHLEHTMGLLWALMMHYSAPGLLLPKSLDAEITRLGGKVPDVKRIERLSAARRGDSVVEAPQCAMEARLFAWARAACATQRVELNNLGSAFTDGRALCALIRAYAPMMIQKRRIGNAPLKLGDANIDVARQARNVARDNFAAVSKALQALGGVPSPTFDIRHSHTADCESPDPRAVSGYLLFLSARLLLLRQQEVACIRIQRWWRWKRPNRPKFAEVVRKWERAVTFIASHVRRTQAVKAVEARKKAIVTVQSFRRACVARRHFLKVRGAAVKIQAQHRMRTARLAFKDAQWAVKKLQKMRRGCVVRKQFLLQRSAACKVQAIRRMVCARRDFLNKIPAAMVIQSHWRGFVARVKAKRIREARMQIIHDAATKLQAAVRKCIVRKQFMRLRWAVVLSQARLRMSQARKKFLAKRSASVTIQRHVRGFLDYNAYQRRSEMIKREKQNSAATTIQRVWRGHRVRDEIRFEAHFVTVIQAYVRGWLARRRYAEVVVAKNAKFKAEKDKLEMRAKLVRDRRERKAATVMQKYLRGFLARKSTAKKLRQAKRKAEKAAEKARQKDADLRAKKQIRLKAARLYNAAETIQSCVRGFLARKKFNRMRHGALVIQKNFRGFIARKSYDDTMAKAVSIQAHVRGMVTRNRSIPKLEWHRKRLARAENTRKTHTRAHQAAMMISRPHKKDDCMRGCMYFIDQWSASKECRDTVTEASILHALMRNIRVCGRAASQVQLLTVAYSLLEVIARDRQYAHTLADSPDSMMVILEHLQMFRDRPALLESAVNVMVALSNNATTKKFLASEKCAQRLEQMMGIIRCDRVVHRRSAMSYAQQGCAKEEQDAREALTINEQALLCLKKLNALVGSTSH